ncbi:unnamed protein product [Durusdinium trenchii]|uniref:Uncharacterized protein n=1 Tax=Durusdinium trenchii TaxID=1381693 RepID=A0ABP0RWS4_9DINO
MYLRSAREEAMEAWSSYEEPLQTEALALAVSRREARELEEHSASGFQLECHLREEMESLQHQLAQLDQHHQDRAQAHLHSKKKAADLDDLVQHLKKQTERHEAAISHAKTTVSSQEAELTKLEQIASTHQSRVHAARHELDYVAKELSDRSASQSGFQQQVSILQQELQAQEAQLEACNRETAAYRRRAMRAESIRLQNDEDMPSGIRALRQQCSQFQRAHMRQSSPDAHANVPLARWMRENSLGEDAGLFSALVQKGQTPQPMTWSQILSLSPVVGVSRKHDRCVCRS